MTKNGGEGWQKFIYLTRIIMKKIALFLFSVLLSISIQSQTIYKDYLDGKLYLKIKPGYFTGIDRSNPRNISISADPQLNKLFLKYGVTKISKPFFQATDNEHLPNILKVEFTAKTRVNQFIADLESVNGVEYSEKVPLVRVFATPNDPVFPPHLTQIGANNAWNIFNGNSNVKVAIVDNAVMWNHADLLANTYTNTAETPNNGIDDDHNGYIDDVNGFSVADNNNNPAPTNTNMIHGTHCAGIAGAVTDNSVGIASIGWNIKIIPVQCEPDNSSSMTNLSNGYEGIVYASRAGARVISCSWGSTGTSTSEQYVINYAWDRGAIVMAAAGNSSTNTPHYPAAYNNVYCIASVGGTDVKSSFSNYGTWVDIAAPGNTIISTVPYASTATPLYQQSSGTSMATPLVAGLAGLMLSKSPAMTRLDVINCINSTATNIYTLSGNSAYVSGSQLGAGRIDAFLAMQCAANYSATAPVANFYAMPRDICAGASVSFKDSSLYNPTTYFWTFQGGSPSTSTLTNPVVTYSANGSYSATLFVTNATGSTTISKLNYITVSSPINLPFSEGFQNTAFLPTGWSSNNIWNDAIYWTRVTGIGGYGTSTACARFDNYNLFAPDERDEMRTPRLNFSSVSNSTLTFDVAYARYNSVNSDSLEVKVSTDCGATWTSIYLKGGTTLATASDQTSPFVPTTSQWRTESVNISTITALAPNVMFSFINRGRYGQNIFLDNINIVTAVPNLSMAFNGTVCEGAPVTFTNNSTGAGSYTWTLPGSTTAISNATTPVVTFTAAGIYTITLVGASGSNTALISQTISVLSSPSISASSQSLCAGATITISPTGASTYTFMDGTNFLSSGTSLTLTPASTKTISILAGNAQCTTTANITASVVPLPIGGLVSQTICAGNTTTLSAGTAGSYTWSNGSNASSIVITPTQTSVFTITLSNSGCDATDAATITIGTGLSLQITATPTAVCIGNSSTLTVTGGLTYTWSTSALTNTIVVTPTTTSTYSVDGLSGTCTGSAQITLSVNPIPNINITASPSSTICPGTTLTLSASGASTYTWNTNQTSGTIAVSPTTATSYSVIGSDLGCIGTASIDIQVGTVAVTLSLTASDTLVCGNETVNINVTGASNYTWSNGSTGSQITLTPTTTTTYSVIGSIGGCTGIDSVEIIVSSLPVTIISTSSTPCENGCNGLIQPSTSGGTTPYTYSINNNSCTTMPCKGLCPGLYTLLTVDSLGCSNTKVFSIGNSGSTLLTSFSFTHASCATCTDGAISVLATGGLSPYTFSWSTGSSTTNVNDTLSPGCYTVTIKDAGGCRTSRQICLSVTGLITTSDNPLNVYPNPTAGKFNVEMAGLYSLKIYNHLGQLVVNIDQVNDMTEVDLSQMASGIYHVEVIASGQRQVTKIIKE